MERNEADGVEGKSAASRIWSIRYKEDNMRKALICAGMAALFVACDGGRASETPQDLASAPETRGAETIAEVASPPPVYKLDVLWVVDNSASMCQEQRGLATHVQDFVDALPDKVEIELRMAVITTDVLKGQGAFVEEVATKYPNACAETRLLACTTDAECQAALPGPWTCNPPPSTGGVPLQANMNGSMNSSCSYLCETSHECCDVFCPSGECGDCTHECVAPGGSASYMNCVAQPLSCDGDIAGDWDAWGRCHLQVGADQSFTANLESGVKAAWMALDPAGLNAAQAAGFLRPDAHLLVVFVSDEDDCSISEEFCGPNWECEHDNDCPGYTRCEGGLCCGVIKKDYYNICGLLGEYKGEEHHDCAYDAGCADCASDEDCDRGWGCTEEGKCRPAIFGLKTVSSFQDPAGSPIFSLAPVADYGTRLQSLKEGPLTVLVASISGDAMAIGEDPVSMISEECLAGAALEGCVEYQAAKDVAAPACLADPHGAGCEALLEARMECARDCYVASRGELTNPQAKSSYICTSDHGTADWGSRYMALAGMFGEDGFTASICAPDGMGPVMQDLGDFVAGRMD